MNAKDIAKEDLKKCKMFASREKIRNMHKDYKYAVYSDGSIIPTGFFNSRKEAQEYVDECIRYDNWLYKKFEDECILVDYWIVEIKEYVVEYYIRDEEECI